MQTDIRENEGASASGGMPQTGDWNWAAARILGLERDVDNEREWRREMAGRLDRLEQGQRELVDGQVRLEAQFVQIKWIVGIAIPATAAVVTVAVRLIG